MANAEFGGLRQETLVLVAISILYGKLVLHFSYSQPRSVLCGWAILQLRPRVEFQLCFVSSVSPIELRDSSIAFQFTFNNLWNSKDLSRVLWVPEIVWVLSVLSILSSNEFFDTTRKLLSFMNRSVLLSLYECF